MPLVDASDPSVYHLNHVLEANRLWYNHTLHTQIPVGAKSLPINYIRFARLFIARNHAKGLVAALNLQDGMTIALPGAGFGWLEEELQKLLPTASFASFETGLWIHSVKDVDETAEVDSMLDAAGITDQAERDTWQARLVDGPRAKVVVDDESLSTKTSQKNITTKLGLTGNQKADWAITEQVLPWLDDAECQKLSTDMHKIATNVAHLASVFMSSKASEQEKNPWNWKHQDSTEPTTDLLAAQPWYTTTSWKALLPNDVIVAPSFKYRAV